MLNTLEKIKQKHAAQDSGFTIIEVMIVLAIAGLIILIVLLAVPALQRNGRNTAIKTDASGIAGALSTFDSDNDGKVPAAADFAYAAPVLTIGAAGTSQATAKVQSSDTIPTPAATKAPTTAITPGTIIIVKALTCAGTASTRAFSVWYSIETGGAVPKGPAFNNKCIDA